MLGNSVGVLIGNSSITSDALLGSGAFRGANVWVPIDSPGLSDFTILMWIKFLTLPVRDSPVELFKWGTARLQASFNSLLTFTSGNGRSMNSDGSGQQLGANTWYAIAITRVGTTLSLYVDGYRIASSGLALTDTIGLPSSALTFSAEGVITDDVALFKDTGKTTFEIFSDYAKKRQLKQSYC